MREEGEEPGAASVRAEARRERGRKRATRWGLGVVLAAYLVLGTLYATATPAWQVPDEPAHYNYVRYVAEQGRLPELRPGDFPAEYLEEIKSQRFPPSLSIEPIRYESHQPPLYYALGAGVYRLGQGRLGSGASDRELALFLRLFSVLLGGVTLGVGYGIVRRVYPQEPGLALGTAAFMAFLPMHLAMNAGVNNDSLAELMVALVVWRLTAEEATTWGWRNTVGLGVLLGLALLTKMQAYVAVGVALFALGWDTAAANRSGRRWSWRDALARGGAMLGVALMVVSPWLARNMLLYGPGDPLAMVRHDQVAAGQLTTQQFVAQYGTARWARDLVVTTFHSFWGQFGWMGVPLPGRVYAALGALSALVGAGLALHVLSVRSPAAGARDARWDVSAANSGSLYADDVTKARFGNRGFEDNSRVVPNWRGMALLAAWALGTTLVFLWYNTKYLQLQGRYLFPALVPWGLSFTLGLRTVLRRSLRPVLVALGTVCLALLVCGALQGDFKEFYVALTISAAAAIAMGHWLESRRPGAAMVLAYLGLCGLALACLYLYVVPNLRPPL